MPISDKIAQFVQRYGIERSFLEQGMMTSYEKQLHTEFVEQLTQVEALAKRSTTHSLIEMVVKSVWAGLQANAKKHVHEAQLWASCGWYALDIAKAALEGVVQAGENTLNLVIHPVESAKAMVHGLGSLIMLAGRAVMPLAELHCLREAGRDEQADQAYMRLKQNSKMVLKYCREQGKKIKLHDVVKQGTAFAADIVIGGKLLQAASAICRHAKFLSQKMLSQLKREETVAAYAHGGAEKLLAKDVNELKRVESSIDYIIQNESKVKAGKSTLGPLIDEVVNSVEHVLLAVEKTSQNRIHHILTLESRKHAWHKVIKGEVTWEKVKKIITEVMLEGVVTPEKAVFKKTHIINGEIVDAIFAPRSDKTISLVDAWVRTK